jgi:hypothetical protein
MRLLLIIFICLGSITFFVAKKKEDKVEVNKAGTVKASKIKADEKNESLLRIGIMLQP